MANFARRPWCQLSGVAFGGDVEEAEVPISAFTVLCGNVMCFTTMYPVLLDAFARGPVFLLSVASRPSISRIRSALVVKTKLELTSQGCFRA